MKKIGEFIYPWGNGHFSRMMRLNEILQEKMGNQLETHYFSKGEIYERLLEKFPSQKDKIHEVLMPTPIDGKFGPSVGLSMLNVLIPVSNNKPLVSQISAYLKQERKVYDQEKFDLVINDGDMGSNVLANNRGITSVFVTNQFLPKLWKSRFYFYPSLIFVSKQIAKASKIIVADSPPPYTICEYNLNFPDELKDKVTYVGHFSNNKKIDKNNPTELELLIKNVDFGYWMRTGNISTNKGTGERYEEAFQKQEMKDERRIISHARNDSSLDQVLDKYGEKHTISDALEKKIDWIQIDKGFLSEQEKDTVLNACKYGVVNGSHTVMGEMLGKYAKPIIGIPIYDEHTNQIRWAQEKKLGVMAKNSKQIIYAIQNIKENYSEFEVSVKEFSKNFDGGGAENAAGIVSEVLEGKN